MEGPKYLRVDPAGRFRCWPCPLHRPTFRLVAHLAGAQQASDHEHDEDVAHQVDHSRLETFRVETTIPEFTAYGNRSDQVGLERKTGFEPVTLSLARRWA